MSLDNFIPEVWSNKLLVNLYKSLRFAQDGVINRDYEGDISAAGDTVRINAIGRVTVGDYSKNTDMGAPQTLTDAQSVLTISQQKFFNFQVDDIDKAQQNPKVMSQAMVEAAYALANTADQFVAAQYVDISSANRVGGASDTNPLEINPTTDGSPVANIVGQSLAYEALVDASVVLDENDIPEDGRFIIVPPWFEGQLEKDQRFVSFGTAANRGDLENGLSNANGGIGRVAGFTVMKSNNVPVTVNGDGTHVYHVIGGHPMMWSFAEQIRDVEGYRPQLRFGDAVKGLHLYGARVVRPNAGVLIPACRHGGA
jgi:N4-gp56 family major capsid protein